MGTAEGPKEEGEATTISSRDSNQPQRSYLALKGFRFQVGGRSEADIQIFLDSCNKHKEDLKNIPDGKLRWANIAKSGAESSTDPENFTISHCLELGESIYFYTENQKESLKEDKTFIDLCDQIKDFKEHLLTPLIKNNAKQSQPGKMEKEIPENKMEEIISIAKQHLSLFNIKGCDKVHVWREVSKKVNIKNADKYLQDNIKSKIINELKNENDPEIKKDKFLKLAQPIIDIFDFIAPRTYKVINYVPDYKQENEEMRKTNDEPVVAEGPPEMILPENVSAKNHEENPKKIKNVKRKSLEPEKNDENVEKEEEEDFTVNCQLPIKKYRKKRSKEVFINGWLNDDVCIFIDACIDNLDKLKNGKQWIRWTPVTESCRHVATNPDCFTNTNCSALAVAFKKKFESNKHLLEQEGREHWKELYDKAQVIWDYLDTEINTPPQIEKNEEPVKKKRGRPPKPVNDVEPDTTSNEEKETQVHKKQRKRQAFSKIKNIETPVKVQEEPSSSKRKTRSIVQRRKKITPKTKDQVDSTTPIIITDVRSLCPEKIIETPETSEACETDTETIETKTIETPTNLPRVRFVSDSQSSPESLETQKVSEIRTGFQENNGGSNEGNIHTPGSVNQFTHTPATSGANQFHTPTASLNQFTHAAPTGNQFPHTPATNATNQFNTPGANLNQFQHTARNQFPHSTPNQFPGTSANPENLKTPNTMNEINHAPMHQIPPNHQGMPVFPPNFMYPYDMANQYFSMNPYNNFMNQPGPSRMPIHAGFQNAPDQMAVVPSHRTEDEIPVWFKQYAQCRDIDHWKFIQLFHQKNEFLKVEKEKVNNLKKILDKLDVLNQDS